jgi:hypothetical protein
MSYEHTVPVYTAAGLLLAALALAMAPARRAPGDRAGSLSPQSPGWDPRGGSRPAVNARLSEWWVNLSERAIAAGTVTFTIANVGTIPHAFEVEGQGIEQETPVIQPGASATLTLTLKPGTYEVYSPAGEDSYREPGMETHLTVVDAQRSDASGDGGSVDGRV